jgi:hypothetical protein
MFQLVASRYTHEAVECPATETVSQIAIPLLQFKTGSDTLRMNGLLIDFYCVRSW